MQPIHIDYSASPYAQKTLLILHLCQQPFVRLQQPPVLPRPDLEALGITYRRIPLLAVGKDVYCDSALITDVVLDKLAARRDGAMLKRSIADKAYAAWGDETFKAVLPLVPRQALTPAFVKDRKTIFPLLQRPDMATLVPSAEAELRSRLAWVEDVFLAEAGNGRGPFSGGSEGMSIADVHIVWALKWVLVDLGSEQRTGMGRQAFPRVWRMIDSLPKVKAESIGSEEGVKKITQADLTASNVDVASDDSTDLKSGMNVEVESMDTTPGAHPQAGKLVGASRHEIVLELPTGVRIHFPRQGYILREAGASNQNKL